MWLHYPQISIDSQQKTLHKRLARTKGGEAFSHERVARVIEMIRSENLIFNATWQSVAFKIDFNIAASSFHFLSSILFRYLNTTIS